jgi:hypothetical protein
VSAHDQHHVLRDRSICEGCTSDNRRGGHGWQYEAGESTEREPRPALVWR